jgi:hypothetical protein
MIALGDYEAQPSGIISQDCDQTVPAVLISQLIGLSIGMDEA